MKAHKKILFITVLFLTVSSLGFSPGSAVWQRLPMSIPATSVNSIAVHPQDASLIFVGTSKALYRSLDRGIGFAQAFQVQGSAKGINYIYITPSEPERVFIATDSGLYTSSDKGTQWQQINNSSDPGERQCFTVLIDGKTVFLGTAKGLLYKNQDASVWQKDSGLLNNSPIYLSAQDGQYLYFGTQRQLVRMSKESHVMEEVFSLLEKEIEMNGDDFEIDQSFLATQQITAVSLSDHSGKKLCIATSRGIFCSPDHGQTWEGLDLAGLPSSDITSMVFANDQSLWVGTRKGTFRYLDNRWIPVYQGMETTEISALANDIEGKIYAGTDRGVFFMSDEKALPSDLFALGENVSPELKESPVFDHLSLKNNFADEPSIRQVQKFAIDYAEVDPKKIQDWRVLARRRAILPTLSAGLNRDAGNLFHWDSGGNPDVLRTGRDYLDWNVSLSWDLGDLVWSTDQTTIDSRSKLMVELREDILDQITRLYFERRRLQVELLALLSPDPVLKADRQMRVEELTALIDALTGGQFSRMIEDGKRNSDK